MCQRDRSGDITVNGQADSYWVEIGDVAGASKYCRSFYANITGNTTYAGMLNSLYTIDFGETDCDAPIYRQLTHLGGMAARKRLPDWKRIVPRKQIPQDGKHYLKMFMNCKEGLCINIA